MSSSESLADLLTKASAHFANARPFLPMYLHLLVSALFPIYTGAHASLSRPSSAAKPDKKTKKTLDEDEDEEDEKIQKMEGLSNTDAVVLPITAGITLGGLYLLIQKYGADLINFVLGWYFSAIGVVSIAKLVNDGLNVLLSFFFPNYYASERSLWKVSNSEQKIVRQDDNTQQRDTPLPPLLNALPLPQLMKNGLWNFRGMLKQKYAVKAYVKTFIDLQAKLTIVNALSGFVGLGAIVYVNTVSKLWFLTNLQGFAVSYAALQLMSPTSFATGSLILGALFCYDVWAVFFTPLMVTVAKNLDQPIKLVFPRPEEPGATPEEPPKQSYSMLGLGDIVLPGIMIGLALRFDLYMFYLKKQTRGRKAERSSSSKEAVEEPKKAPYTSVTGHWGDRFWTSRLAKSSLPSQLSSTFPKPYFIASMVGYVTGMIATLSVMTIFDHAQPALLYLVPGVLVSLWGTAVVRREGKQMWEFSEAVTSDQLDEGQEKKEKENKEAKASKDKKEPEESQKGLFERIWSSFWTEEKEKPKANKRQEASSSKSTTAKKDGKKAADRDPKGTNDDLFVSFSISRYHAKTATSNKQSKASKKAEAGLEVAASPLRSNSSDDGIVVTSDDLDGVKDADEAPSRYRTRSTRSGRS